MSPLRLIKPEPDSEADDAGGSVTPTLEALYRAHSTTVARWAMRLLGPKDEYEDVVHEVFLVARRRLPEFRGEAQITTWLYEITVRVVQAFRRRARWWSWLSGRGQNPSRAGGAEPVPWGAESVSDPEAILQAREQARLLYEVLDELGEEQRTTFILFELDGLSGNQIAAVTRTSVSNVWVRLSRARAKFLERLQSHGSRGKP